DRQSGQITQRLRARTPLGGAGAWAYARSKTQLLREEQMAKAKSHSQLTRRGLIRGAALAGAAAATAPLPVKAQAQPAGPARTQSPPRPDENYTVNGSPITQTTSGSDFMLDVFKSLGFEYLAATCASSFKGLHESVINYGNNVAPEYLTTTHEET